MTDKIPARGRDPRMDEEMILNLLRSGENAQAIQAGAVQALLDMYDRGVTREVFCNHASACLALYSHVAKLWMLNNIRAPFDAGGLTAGSFIAAEKHLLDVIGKQAEEVIALVKSLQACPTSEDAIH